MIVDGGRKCYLKGIVIYNIEKITDEEFDAMEKDYDPIEAPPGPYKIQPHNQGRVRNRLSKLNDNFGRYIFYLDLQEESCGCVGLLQWENPALLSFWLGTMGLYFLL